MTDIRSGLVTTTPINPNQDVPATVGRIVHYVSYGTPKGEYASECRAAIVTEAQPMLENTGHTVALAVLNPTGMFFNRTIAHDESKAPGTWHWCFPCTAA